MIENQLDIVKQFVATYLERNNGSVYTKWPTSAMGFNDYLKERELPTYIETTDNHFVPTIDMIVRGVGVEAVVSCLPESSQQLVAEYLKKVNEFYSALLKMYKQENPLPDVNEIVLNISKFAHEPRGKCFLDPATDLTNNRGELMIDALPYNIMIYRFELFHRLIDSVSAALLITKGGYSNKGDHKLPENDEQLRSVAEAYLAALPPEITGENWLAFYDQPGKINFPPIVMNQVLTMVYNNNKREK